jgi:hypothetical protein
VLEGFGIHLKAIDDVLAVDGLLFDEEISRQFIFIDFDEVDSGLGLTETMMIIESVSGCAT